MVNSQALGKNTLAAEVTNISRHGIWLLTRDKELFLPFDEFPWFKDAPVGKILNVEEPSPGHFYWPELNVDLGVESIEHPERFPLNSEIKMARANRHYISGYAWHLKRHSCRRRIILFIGKMGQKTIWIRI